MIGPRPMARCMAAALATVTLAAGCTVVATGPVAQRPQAPGDGLRRSASSGDAAAANEVVERSITDVERFWAATYPGVSGGTPFQRVKGGYHPYTKADPPPGCGTETGEYQPNAFYCPVGDFIAWDAEVLIPQLHADFGPLLVAVVIAHEYGHAVQARLGGTEQPTVVLEQQADCFAGAWVGDVVAGRSTAFGAISPDQLDDTVAGLLMLRDQPGTSALAPQAHGNAFDRVRAFQEGVEQSAERCAAYRPDNLPVTEVPFSSEQEAATGGDLPYAETVSLLGEDAQAYWQRTFPRLTGEQWQPVRIVGFATSDPPACPSASTGPSPTGGDPAGAAFVCTSQNFVAFDTEQLGPALHQRIGDNAVGMLLAGLFAQTVQQRRGLSTQDRPGQLAVDCLAGSWVNDLLTRDADSRVRLSPGDLDEAVAALLAFGRADVGGTVSAFDRIAAFRNGVLKGLPACS